MLLYGMEASLNIVYRNSRGRIRDFPLRGFPLRGLHYARMSETFQPLVIPPYTLSAEEKGDVNKPLSRSQKLLTETGMIFPSNPAGLFYLLPLFVRSLEKLVNLIDREMREINCQKMILPILNEAAIWQKSGRWATFGNELIRLRDRHSREFCLGPTHEESVTNFVATSMHQIPAKRLPLRLYQITTKFRDEMRPKNGILRAREFIMKDLYTFDSSIELANESYENVCHAYERILRLLELPFIKASASTGMMGGSKSHEFLIPCETVGEDEILMCQRCNSAFNSEILSDGNAEKMMKCPSCSLESSFNKGQAIEVAHSFLLGTRYSQVFNANYLDSAGKPSPLIMGCFGIGVTRLVAAAVESLSSAEEIRWPIRIAPYKLCIISPKAGSKESKAIGPLTEILCDNLKEIPQLVDDIIWDDREELSIGRRLNDAHKTGYPFIVVVGKEAVQAQPKFEIHCGQTPRQKFSFLLQELMDFLKYSCDLRENVDVNSSIKHLKLSVK